MFHVLEDRILFCDGYQDRVYYMNADEMKEAKECYNDMCGRTNTLAPTTCTSNTITVPCAGQVQVSTGSGLAWKNPVQEKGNNPMYIDECVAYGQRKVSTAPAGLANVQVELKMDAKSDGVADQRKYLERRVSDLKYEKQREISDLFHEHEPDGPKTIKELRERLKKGLFTVLTPKNYDESEDDDEDYGFYWRDHFSWRTEDTQFDKAGYQAASAELTAFVQSIVDQIKILDPKDTLSLLEDLKKWKPSKAKK